MGIFDNKSSLWARYHATLQFRDKVMGGTPRDPKLIEGWIRAKAGLVGNEAQALLIRTMVELGIDVQPDMTLEQLEEASSKVAGLKETTGLKRDENGLFVEERQFKAMLNGPLAA